MNLMTVNIEKKLLKENQKLATPQELLVIKEFERVGKIDDSTIISRLGMDRNLRQGERKKHEITQSKQETLKFDQSRVFHISQIESICNKYYLKFLPADMFRGSIDTELPQKLTTFEVAHGERLNPTNSYIIAPARSFELEKKPKDPLFFFKINNEYYYLIHKWGNDLNIFRRILPLCSKIWFTVVSLLVLLAIPPVLLGVFVNPFLWLIGVGSYLFFIGFITSRVMNKGRASYIAKNEYNSQFYN